MTSSSLQSTILFFVLLTTWGTVQAFGPSPTVVRTRPVTHLAAVANLTSPDVQSSPSRIPPSTTTGHTAILLNPNARSVTPRVVATARRILGDAHVYVTDSADAAAATVQALAKNNLQKNNKNNNNNNNNNDSNTHYSLIVPAGGDGTLAHVIDLWTEAILEHSNETTTVEAAVAQLPAFAYLPLGTGNGLGSVVGNPVKPRWSLFRSRRRRQAQLADTLTRLQQVAAVLEHDHDHHVLDYHDENDEWECLQLPMMQVTSQSADQLTTQADVFTNNHKGDLCFFAGVGFDSLMLNDFKQIKAWSVQTGVLKKFLGSVAGYCVALVVRTLPQSLRGKHRIHVKVTTPRPALWVDHSRGDVVRPVGVASSPSSSSSSTTNEKKESILFEGTTGIVAAGTSPFYGGGLRLFPFARMTVDQMHLRVGRIPPWQGILQLPQIFAGTYRDTTTPGRRKNLGCLDFIGEDFEVEVEPLVGGVRKEKAKDNNRDTNDNDQDGEEGYPLQHSGEAVGHVKRFRLRVVKEPIRFVCLKRKPLP